MLYDQVSYLRQLEDASLSLLNRIGKFPYLNWKKKVTCKDCLNKFKVIKIETLYKIKKL